MNLENQIHEDDLIKRRDEIKKVFFYRICGTGMGACACLLKEAGFEVHGADQNFYPPMSTYLENTNIELFKLDEISDEFLKNYDLIIVGNSVPRQSDHARRIEDCGVPFTSFPSALGALVLRDKNVIGIAGTHGKTTTTYFLKQILNNLKEDCGYFIGGILDDAPPAKIGQSKYFVIESDEYDSAYFQKIAKFRLYELNQMILTSLEFDHADIYDTVEDIEKEFLEVTPSLSRVVANGMYNSIEKIKNEDWLLYGDHNGSGPRDIRFENGKSYFSLLYKEEELKFETSAIGEHNILNITSCILLLLEEGFSYTELQKAVAELALVKRRQEVRGHYKGAVIIDDFAHHPRAIKLTLEALKTKYPLKDLVTIFEPVSATARSNHFQKEFAECFGSANEVVIAQSPMKTTARGKSDLDCEKLAEDINEQGITCSVVQSLDDTRLKIDELCGPNKVLAILSNRSCLGLWESDFVKDLS